MPIYDYECTSCCFRFEMKQHFCDEPVAACPLCNAKSRRVLHSIPIVYKGSGFYTTDHGRGSSSNSRSESQETTAQSQETKTEVKAEVKAKAKAEAKD